MRSLATATTSKRALSLFFSYAHEDVKFRDALEKHLSVYKRNRDIQTWYDRDILPGTPWRTEIDAHINTADIILLLVSPAFVQSDYCYGIEMERALERHRSGSATVIPIIIRPISGFASTPLGGLQALPTDATAVSLWKKPELAYVDIADGIQRLIRARSPSLIEWMLVLSGSSADMPGGFRQRVETVLRALTNEEAIRVVSTSPGSIRLTIQSSEQAFQTINNLFARGELGKALDAEILEVRDVKGASLRIGFMNATDATDAASDISLPDDLAQLPSTQGNLPQLRVLSFPVSHWTQLSFGHDGDASSDPNLVSRLGRYFQTCLIVKSEEQHVDLSPFKANCGLPQALRRTELGAGLLQQDLELKRITAAYLHPDFDSGRAFWNSLLKHMDSSVQQIAAGFRVWIVPSKASISERMRGDEAQVVLESVEPDILSEIDRGPLNGHLPNGAPREQDDFVLAEFNRHVLPSIRAEVLTSLRFAPLRQMLSAMVLAAWYRRQFGQHLSGFLDSNQTAKHGLDMLSDDDRGVQEYQQLYKRGIWRALRRDINGSTGELLTRTLVAGAIRFDRADLVDTR